MDRCEWAGNELMISYHDEEWGVPLHDDRRLFEFLMLDFLLYPSDAADDMLCVDF